MFLLVWIIGIGLCLSTFNLRDAGRGGLTSWSRADRWVYRPTRGILHKLSLPITFCYSPKQLATLFLAPLKAIFKKWMTQKNFNVRIWIHNQSELFEIANKFDKFGLKEALWKPWWEVTLQAQDSYSKKGVLTGADENLKKLDASYTAGGSVQWCSHFGNGLAV